MQKSIISPASSAAKLCLFRCLYEVDEHVKMAGAAGIEPTPKVLETFVLPLNYAPKERKMEADGFEPPNSKRADLQSAVFSHFTKPPYINDAARQDYLALD